MNTRTAPKPVFGKYSLHTSRQVVSLMERIADLYPGCDEKDWKQALSTELEAQTVGLPDYVAEIFRCELPSIASRIVNRYVAALFKAGTSLTTQGPDTTQGLATAQGPDATQEPTTTGIPRQSAPPAIPGATVSPRPVQLALPILERIDVLIAAISAIRVRQREKFDKLHGEWSRLEVLVQEQRDELRQSEEAERYLPTLRELSVAHPMAESIEDLVEIARVTVPDFTIDSTTVQWIRERLAA